MRKNFEPPMTLANMRLNGGSEAIARDAGHDAGGPRRMARAGGQDRGGVTCSCPCCTPRYAPELVAATGGLDTRRNP